MNLSCGSRAIKYLMFIFNFVFVITGIILIAIGATIKSNYKEYDTVLDGKYFSLPNLLIATGILIFVISFLGCYGAIKESWIILMAFSVLLGVIFIFEFSAGIAGYVLRDKTATYLEKTFYDSMSNYNNSLPIAKMWDLIQSEFECCGVINAADWDAIFKEELPISCCPRKFGAVGDFHCNTIQDTTTVAPSTKIVRKKREITDDVTPKPNPEPTTANTTTPAANTTTPVPNPTNPSPITTNSDKVPSTTEPYTNGCEFAFGDYVREHAVKIGMAGFVLAIIQIIGVAFSCHLARQLKNQYYST